MERPVVATRVNGVSEILGEDAPEMIPPRDPEALAAAMLEVHASSEPARQRARRGRERIRKAFSLEAMVENWQALYDEVLARS